MVDVLLIEDQAQLAVPVARQLDELGHHVTWTRDPVLADSALQDRDFGVVVADVLFEELTRRFDDRRTAREVSLTSPLLVTGIAAATSALARDPAPGVVLWTRGESNRRLHLLFAYEQLGIRTFCSKSAGSGEADALHRAILAASVGRICIDPVLSGYLTTTGGAQLCSTLLRDSRHRAIWRALAIGHLSRDEIARVTGYAERTVGNAIGRMVEDLESLNPAMHLGCRPLAELIRFASSNWEFFLDDAVRRVHG